MLILSAEVGEGHAAAARALREQLQSRGEPIEVEVIDGLAAMGERLRSVVEDGYRTQLRVSPRSYSIYYWLLEHLAPVRALTKLALCRLGAKSLRREILARNPDVVVSTYPAITVVLSHLRRRRLLDIPAVATITDMTGLFFWAQRGIDTHLVMYEQSLSDVERIAGRGSAQIVRPLIAAEFLKPRERGAARAALALPAEGRVVVVSGGGWGVGDLEGAVDELTRIPDATVICLAGRNSAERERLGRRFAAIERVRVLGFTDQMPDLLAAADVLVHSTGGVTCLEAMARGCPVVSYGLAVGHAKLNTRMMAAHEYLLLAEDPLELVERVEHGCASRPSRPAAAARTAVLDAASAVLAAPMRVSQIARWRLRAASIGIAALLSLSAGAWVMSTDEVAAFASVVGIHPVKTVKTIYPAVGVIVDAPAGQAATVAGRLRHDGIEASIATAVVPHAAVQRLLRRSGDELIPTIARTGLFAWIGTPTQLRREARALHLRRHYYYLEPQSPSLGELLLARTAGGLPVHGSVALDAKTSRPQRPLHAGDVVVITFKSTSATLRAIDRLAHVLHADELVGLSLSRLLG
ncbi:MAG TPA: glycosyltransferase [Solirubrobacteraceae bacterium]|nr:glycosyltransferase [Solirubrobacteraceae bacterium]